MITLRRNEFYTVCTQPVSNNKEVKKFGGAEIEMFLILLIIIFGSIGYLWETKIKDLVKEHQNNK